PPCVVLVTHSPTSTPSGTYEPTITRSASRTLLSNRPLRSSRLLYSSVRPWGGFGRSRFEAYQGTSLSRKRLLCPRAASSRTKPRYVVACPLPHDEVIDSPSITMSSG